MPRSDRSGIAPIVLAIFQRISRATVILISEEGRGRLVRDFHRESGKHQHRYATRARRDSFGILGGAG
jgi:hypothetical protein